MLVIAVLYFLFISMGLGLAAWKLLGISEEDGVARLFLYIAGGMVVFVQATTLLGFLHLSNWLTYLVLTVVLLALAFRKWDFSLRMPALSGVSGASGVSRTWVMISLLFVVHLCVYFIGATGYPWLEDDDPWGHATAVQYASAFSTYIQPAHLPIHYLAPYPPFFDVLLGVLFQVSGGSLQMVLKFFNALVISLAIPFFFCWARTLIGERKALWATFILAALPCFMSHFIWSQSLAVTLVFPALYFLERFRTSHETRKSFGIFTVLACAAVMISQPSAAAMFLGLLGVYLAAMAISGFMAAGKVDIDSFRWPLIIIAAAFVLALLEFWIPMFTMYTADQVLDKLSLSVKIIADRYGDTGGGLIYGAEDFLNAPESSKMDQPVGIGIAACLLVLGGIIAAVAALKKDRADLVSLVLLLWLAYCFIGVEGNVLPLKLVPHRFWVFLAIPVALLAGSGAVWLLELVKGRFQRYAWIAAVVLFLAVFASSVSPKVAVETSQWPPGAMWLSYEQMAGYSNLLNLTPQTKVFSFCMSEDAANGFDKFAYAWEKEVTDYKNVSVTESADSNYAFLKKYGYSYAIIDQACTKRFSTDQINAKANALLSDTRFSPAQSLSNQAVIVFEVK